MGSQSTNLQAAIVCVSVLGVMAPALGGPRHHKPAHAHLVSSQEAHTARTHQSALRHKLHSLHGRLHSARERVHHARSNEHHITESIGTVRQRIAVARGRINAVDNRLARLGADHVRLMQRMDATQRRLADRRSKLATRIRDDYQRGQMSYAQVLLESRSVHDLLSRGYYVRQIVHSDTDLIQGVQRDIAQIDADRRTLEAQQRESEALGREYEQQKAGYQSDLKEEQQMLAAAQDQEQQAQEDLQALEEESAATGDQIRSLQAIYDRFQQEQREKMIRSMRGSHLGRRIGEIIRSSMGGVWNGRFLRPVPGPITSGFGYRYHPILHIRRMHTGVDFGAGYGTPIHAAAAGTVIMAGYSRGYGNRVVVYHGGGMSTLYGHCSDLVVSTGQTVQAGDVIAHVGATGMATGPHLHFEVRRNGVPIRPY